MNCEITDYSNVLMPFGKYKGKRIKEIAEIKSSNGFEKGKDYLRWLLEKIPLRSHILQESIEYYLDE
jgi:uncharacterized protein (DUF3820 family)